MELDDRRRVATLGISNPNTTNGPQLSPEALAILARSLIISPDLDALLEHEDRYRARKIVTVAETRAREAGYAVEVGLPPPPRRTRQGRKIGTAEAAGASERSTSSERRGASLAEEFSTRGHKSAVDSMSSSVSNPYINPAPNLQDIFGTAVDLLSTSQDATTRTTTKLDSMMYTLHDPRSETLEAVKDIQVAQEDYDGPRDNLPKTCSLQELEEEVNQQSYHPRLSLTTTDKSIKEQEFVKGRTINMNCSNSPRIKDESTVFKGHRPLLSHGQQLSISSIDSFDSYGPPSTSANEHPISISTTLNQDSQLPINPSTYNNPSPTFDMNTLTHDSSSIDQHPNFERQQRHSIDSQQSTNLSPLEFNHTPLSENSTRPFDPPKTDRAYVTKPPIPTAPKPLFSRAGLRLSRNSSPRGSASSQPGSDYASQPSVRPLTTNFLDLEERADLVRKTRKLARVFGQTPDGDIMVQQESGRSIQVKVLGKSTPARLLTNTRRHSMPLSPEDFSFLSIVSPTDDAKPTLSERIVEIGGVAEPVSLGDHSNVHHQSPAPNSSSPPTSFIDLSENVADKTTGRILRHRRSISQSTIETTNTSLLDGDDDRRRKRERLAKLHRYLGSRVPVGLVLGIDDSDDQLPPPLSPSVNKNRSPDEEGTRRPWLSRKRSSSTTSLLPILDDMDRLRVELDDREKAINVRRAQKMEKVFGVAPPQTLYHTRHSASPSMSFTRPPVERVAGFIPTAPESELISFSRNPNRSSYMKSKSKKHARPSTSESNKQLLSNDHPSSTFDDRFTDNHTLMYSHYHHSLNSLNDILDREDRESLAELHQYLHGAEPTSPPVAYSIHRKLSNASVKSERRRSLPARTSMNSLASEFTVEPAKADPTAFQMRRRRAAKLTQFFGVDYRELISDVLDSIENSVEQEQRRGTLREEEVEDLLDRLRNLKIKRTSFI